MLHKIEDTLVISENNFDAIITNEEILRVIKIWSYKKITYFFSLKGPKGRVSGVEELESEIIIKILKTKNSFIGKTVIDFKKILPNLITNICKDELNYIKVREKYSRRESEILQPHNERNVEEELLNKRDETKLLLDTLGDECKELLLMHYLDKISQKKIADDLKVHRNTISKKIFDCLQKLGEIKNGL